MGGCSLRHILQKCFVMVEAHADHIDNLQVEAGCLKSSMNIVSSDAFHNVKLMVSQLKMRLHVNSKDSRQL